MNLPRRLSFDRDEVNWSQFANARVIELTRRFLPACRELEMQTLRIFAAFASLKAKHVHPEHGAVKAEALKAQAIRSA